MSDTQVLPELKQIVGALLFAAKGSVSLADIRRCLRQVAEERGGAFKDFAEVGEADLRTAVGGLQGDLRASRLGIHLNEVAGGYRMENDANCGPWLRQLLQKGRASRLSRPALETLAVIAYRQPCTRAEIESVRGVAVDQILRNLIDLQLIRITGRSELPGRPWQFGTTQKFLEYFGLKDVKDLPGVEELRRMEAEQEARKAEAGAGSALEDPGTQSGEGDSVAPGKPDSEPDTAPRPDKESGPESPEGDEDEYDDEDDEDEYDDEDDEDEEEDDGDEEPGTEEDDRR